MSDYFTVSSFRLDISYAQIAVFGAGLKNPFNDWTPAHVHQGFAWRPESVSFKCLGEGGEIDVSVVVKSHFDLRSDTLRAIQVLFTAPSSGQIEIASIGDGVQLEMGKGAYDLFFETGVSPTDGIWCRFSFVPGGKGSFGILRVDPGLRPVRELVLTAEPAA